MVERNECTCKERTRKGEKKRQGGKLTSSSSTDKAELSQCSRKYFMHLASKLFPHKEVQQNISFPPNEARLRWKKAIQNTHLAFKDIICLKKSTFVTLGNYVVLELDCYKIQLVPREIQPNIAIN